MDNNKPNISTESPQGAFLYTDYQRRRMKAYPVTEPELKHISFMNALTTMFFSGASFCGALIFGILTNASFVAKDQTPPEGKVLMGYAVPGLTALALVFIVAGLCALRSKASTWNEIKATSEAPSEQTPSGG